MKYVWKKVHTPEALQPETGYIQTHRMEVHGGMLYALRGRFW